MARNMIVLQYDVSGIALYITLCIGGLLLKEIVSLTVGHAFYVDCTSYFG